MILMTEIFEDGFEDDFLSWDGSNNTPVISTTVFHHTGKSEECNQTTEYVWKTFAEQTTVFVRAYFMVNALPTDNTICRPLYLLKGTTNVVSIAFYRNPSGTLQFYLRTYFPATQTDFYSFNFEVDTWYCLEIKWLRDAVNGELRLWLEDVEICAITGIDTTGVTGVDCIRVGQVSSSYVVTNWVDCVVVADEYIGSEGGEEFFRSVDEGLRFGDAVSRQVSCFRSVSEGLREGDAVSPKVAYTRSLSEGLSCGDAVSSKVDWKRFVSEGLRFGDAVSRSPMIFYRSLSEALRFGETVSPVASFKRSVAEGLRFGDAVSHRLVEIVERAKAKLEDIFR